MYACISTLACLLSQDPILSTLAHVGLHSHGHFHRFKKNSYFFEEGNI